MFTKATNTMPGDRSRHQRQKLGSSPRPAFLSVNIEGLSAAKKDLLAVTCKDMQCDILCLQEMHRGRENNFPSIWQLKDHIANTEVPSSSKLTQS